VSILELHPTEFSSFWCYIELGSTHHSRDLYSQPLLLVNDYVQCKTSIFDFTGDIPTIELFARKPYGNNVVWGDWLPNGNCDWSDKDTDIRNELLYTLMIAKYTRLSFCRIWSVYSKWSIVRLVAACLLCGDSVLTCNWLNFLLSTSIHSSNLEYLFNAIRYIRVYLTRYILYCCRFWTWMIQIRTFLRFTICISMNLGESGMVPWFKLQVVVAVHFATFCLVLFSGAGTSSSPPRKLGCTCTFARKNKYHNKQILSTLCAVSLRWLSSQLGVADTTYTTSSQQ